MAQIGWVLVLIGLVMMTAGLLIVVFADTPAKKIKRDNQPGIRSKFPTDCKADFYALWCDACNVHPSECPLKRARR